MYNIWPRVEAKIGPRGYPCVTPQRFQTTGRGTNRACPGKSQASGSNMAVSQNLKFRRIGSNMFRFVRITFDGFSIDVCISLGSIVVRVVSGAWQEFWNVEVWECQQVWICWIFLNILEIVKRILKYDVLEMWGSGQHFFDTLMISNCSASFWNNWTKIWTSLLGGSRWWH